MTFSVKNIFLLLIFLLFCQHDIVAQNQLNFRQFKTDTELFLKQPTKWESRDWGLVGLSAVSSILLMQFDENVRDEVLLISENVSNFLVEFGRIWGEPYNTALISGVNALTGIANNDYMNKKVAFEIIQSALYTGLITQLMKVTFGRSRPYKNEGSSNFSPINFSGDDEWSFPSGHTSLGFSLSTVLSLNAKNEFMKVLYYLPALLTAYSRVYQDKHWISDVFLGAVIGYAIGKWTVRIHDQNDVQNFPVQQFTFILPL